MAKPKQMAKVIDRAHIRATFLEVQCWGLVGRVRAMLKRVHVLSMLVPKMTVFALWKGCLLHGIRCVIRHPSLSFWTRCLGLSAFYVISCFWCMCEKIGAATGAVGVFESLSWLYVF
jgi:hypothetical protein